MDGVSGQRAPKTADGRAPEAPPEGGATRPRDRLLVRMALIGAASAIVGYWLGPQLMCSSPSAGGYCELAWWAIVSHVVVAISGVIAGLVGPSAKRWLAGLAGVVAGVWVGPLIAFAFAIVFRDPAQWFGTPPQLEADHWQWFCRAFTVVGSIAFTLGYGVGAGVAAVRRYRSVP